MKFIFAILMAGTASAQMVDGVIPEDYKCTDGISPSNCESWLYCAGPLVDMASGEE